MFVLDAVLVISGGCCVVSCKMGGGQRKEEDVVFAARRGACGLDEIKSRRSSLHACLCRV